MNFYDRDYKVKNWVLIQGLAESKTNELLKFFSDAEAKVVYWPGATFKDTLMTLKAKGWDHAFERNFAKKLFLNPQFLEMAIIKHLREFNPNVSFFGNFTVPTSKIDREIRGDEDYERIFNEMVLNMDSRVLSYTFKIFENCHAGDRVFVFVSQGNIPASILNRLADNIITIKPEQGDINTKGKKIEEIKSEIVEKIKNV